MSDIKQTVDNDIAITNNSFTLVYGPEEVKQRLQQRLSTFLGEWFLDNTIGIPYYEDILIKNPNASLVDALLKSKIVETPGVLELISYESDLGNDRKLTITFTVRSVAGNVELEVII